jgi:transcriptional regulator with XRE-family HTH domain
MSLWAAHERAINRKLPQREVAEAIGCSQRAMSALRRTDGRMPSAKILQGLADFFGVDQNWLTSGKGEPTPIETLNTKETELLLLFRALSGAGRAYILGRAHEIFNDERQNSPAARRPSDDDDRSEDKSASGKH